MLYAAHKPQYWHGKLIVTWQLVGDEEVFLQHRPPPHQGKEHTVIPSAVPAPCTAKQTPFPQCRTVKGRKVAMKAARACESSDDIPWLGAHATLGCSPSAPPRRNGSWLCRWHTCGFWRVAACFPIRLLHKGLTENVRHDHIRYNRPCEEPMAAKFKHKNQRHWGMELT
jgi:hypothetical protein